MALPAHLMSLRVPPAPHLPFQLTLALLKPTLTSHQPHVSEVLSVIRANSFQVLDEKRLAPTPPPAVLQEFYREHEGRFFYERLIRGMGGGEVHALILGGRGAISRWRALIGPTKVYRAKHTYPHTLRARYGLTDTRNAFHGSDAPASAAREIGFVFGEKWDVRGALERGRREAEEGLRVLGGR